MDEGPSAISDTPEVELPSRAGQIAGKQPEL